MVQKSLSDEPWRTAEEKRSREERERHCEPVTDVTGVAIRVQPGALHSAAGLRPAGSISVSPVLLFQIKACALIWRGRRKERICSFRGAYSNRGNGMQRVSSDVGGCGFPRQCAHWLGMTSGKCESVLRECQMILHVLRVREEQRAMPA